MNLFTDQKWEFKVSKDRPLKLFETFAGIGSQTQALKNLEILHEVVAISEIDKYAIMSYEAIHGKVNNLGDISKISADTIPDHDLLTYSFPCQDISIAGKLNGITKKTRSGLLWEVARLLQELKELNKLPAMLLMENVKNLLSENFKDDYYKWLQFLEDLGYSNYSKVLNAKDYGIPQNRERVFCVSVLGNYYYEFPKPIPLTLCLKDMLQDNPNSIFAIQGTSQDNSFKGNGKVCSTLTAAMGTGGGNVPIITVDKTLEIDNPLSGKTDKSWLYEQNVYSENSRLIRTLKAGGGSGNIPKILQVEGKYYLSKKMTDGLVKTGKKKYINQDTQASKVHDITDIAPTICAGSHGYANGYIKTTGKNNIKYITHDELNKLATNFQYYTRYKDKEGILFISKEPNNSLVAFDCRSPGTQTTRRVYAKEAIGPSLNTFTIPKILIAKELNIPCKTKKGYMTANEGDGVYIDRPHHKRGTVQKAMIPTLKTSGNDIGVVDDDLRIRKLTPRECWRLMGFKDEQFEKAAKVCSDSQLYKQAGNSIVVPVLEYIFDELLMKE